MAVTQLPSGRWLVDVNPSRATKRVRRVRKTKAEALRLERELLSKFEAGHDLMPKKDTRSFLELIELYYDLHVRHLTCKKPYATLLILCKLSGNPPAYRLNSAWFHGVRAERSKTVGANTLNHDRAYLHAMFNKLKRSGHWSAPNPAADTDKIKHNQPEMSFLSQEQIHLLLTELSRSRSRHVYPVALICLSTGARWTEAETLTRQQVQNGSISFWKTKSKKPRHIPITPQLEALINNHQAYSVNRLFAGCYTAFTLALQKTGIQLPRGQRTHVLRHTFASWFMINGGNLLHLQKILGHSTIEVTMRYAHLAPGHLESAREFNPVRNLGGHNVVSVRGSG
ncbi:MAG: tyrosine-type recombinase/integrase [Marinospirillum sp.]|uniref:phage integrase n=1 Tax=Marinospirillum sp. TaxID=2183934 RepID=UPI0019EE0EE5|nr:tyrosine-type recombinase/integrase [Marinospirillum sp.]MBE0507901.1 tyrosine-type recombinase/integrase [Marinospirillum sp.]